MQYTINNLREDYPTITVEAENYDDAIKEANKRIRENDRANQKLADGEDPEVKKAEREQEKKEEALTEKKKDVKSNK